MVKWRRVGSDNVIDRRGRRAPGGGFGLPMKVGGGLGVGGLLIVLAVLFLGNVLGGGGGGGLGDVLDGLAPAPGSPGGDVATPPVGDDPDADLVDFMTFILEDAQATWTAIFEESQLTYREADLVLFTDATQSGCGFASAQIGPHYCPLDERIYLDLDFFRDLRSRFGAPGDFAQAYVLAHEVAHHVQNVTGLMDQVRELQQADPGQANQLSIALELQADCLAGVWAHTTYERDLLESGDLEEGLAAAAAVGDDRIQEQATGQINPETWTHGSSEQRVEWFRRGFDTGDAESCDPFAS